MNKLGEERTVTQEVVKNELSEERRDQFSRTVQQYVTPYLVLDLSD